MNTNSRNLTLLTDLYELTMMQGYFKTHSKEHVVFDVFYRQNPCGGAYAIACGLDQAIDYIKDLHFEQEDIDYLRSTGFFQEDFLDYLKSFRFTGDIYAIPEGTIIFPKEPLVKVIAPIMEAQLVETALLNIINHQSLIATKAARVVQEAGGGVMEFGLRRAQGPDAGIYGARAAVIAGCIRNLISDLSQDRIVLIATHVVSDIEFISKEILLMKNGRLIDKASPEQLQAKIQGKVFEMSVGQQELEEVKEKFEISNLFRKDGQIIVRVVTQKRPEGYDEIREAAPTLEDVYLYEFEVKGAMHNNAVRKIAGT